MTEIIFSLPHNFFGRIVSEQSLDISREALLLQAYVPGIEFVRNASYYDVSVRHRQSERKRLVRHGTEITLYDRWDHQVSLDVFHLLYSVARKHYLDHRLFPVHAACVGGESLTLLVGHTGSGKTSITQALLSQGMNLFSGNKTVISFEDETLEATASTPTITGKIDDTPSFSGLPYGDRIAYRLSPDRYAKQGPIDSIVLLRLSDGKHEWKVRDPLSALHTLYPYFLDVTNADTIVEEQVIDGSTSPATKEYLVQNLARILEKVPLYEATGSVTFISEKVMGIRT